MEGVFFLVFRTYFHDVVVLFVAAVGEAIVVVKVLALYVVDHVEHLLQFVRSRKLFFIALFAIVSEFP